MKARILSTTLILITTFALVFAPVAHAGWFDVFKQTAGLIQGFGGVPGLSGGTGATGGEVPVFNSAIEEIKKKEVGSRKINIPGIGSIGVAIPGVSGSLDGIAWQLGRMALNKITKDIVSWIKGGGRNGKPLFVTNWEDFLKDAANEASGIFIEELELTELCKPFKPRIQLLIAGGGRAPYYQRARCTIEDVANNLERFYRNFKQGGWERWFQITMVPQNNFYGAYYLSLEEKLVREATALETSQSMAIAGGGFLGQEECVETAKRKSEGGTYPDDFVGQLPCLKWRTITPGTLVQEQLIDVFGSDIRQLELADEIDEIIGAAFQRLLSNFRGKSNSQGRPYGIAGSASQEPVTQFNNETRNEIPTAIQQTSDTLELPQAIALAQQTTSIKQDSISKVNSLINTFVSINLCQNTDSDSDDRIETSEANIEQLEDDITNINAVTAQLQIGEDELAAAPSTDIVYTLFNDLKSAVNTVISLYNFAVAENNQVAGEVTSAEQELEACENQDEEE